MKYITPFLIAGLLLTSGCARRISQNYYSSTSVGEAAHTYKGVIISARKVEVGEAERLQDNSLGLGAGALAGGIAGSQIGQGSTAALLGGAGGALLGGIAGSYIQDGLSSQTGMEYSVQLDNSQIMTVVQGDEEVYQAGQRVLVIVSKKGRSRIVPDQSTTPASVYAPPQNHPARVARPPQVRARRAAPQARPAARTQPDPYAYQEETVPVPTQPSRAPRQFYVPQEGVSYVNVRDE